MKKEPVTPKKKAKPAMAKPKAKAKAHPKAAPTPPASDRPEAKAASTPPASDGSLAPQTTAIAVPAKAAPAEAPHPKAAPTPPPDGPALPGATPPAASQPAMASTGSAQPAKAPKPREVKEGELPAPSREAWKDVHATLAKRAKAGDKSLQSAWEKACLNGSQQAKREFYYNTFLLDEAAACRSVHKQSLERLKKTHRVIDGWMTKYQIAKLQGADPADPDFNKLADAAVLGLPERPHEVKAWADMGLKQYNVEKQVATEKERSFESRTAANQEVTNLEASEFQPVEKALMAVPESSQVTLGGKPKPEKALANQDEVALECTMEEQYKASYKSLKKAVASLGTAVDKLMLLKEACKKAQGTAPSPQLDASIQELEDLETKYSSSKTQWLEKLGQWKEHLDEPEKGQQYIEALDSQKREADQTYKSLQKAIGPHRLWAKNAKVI